MAEDPQDAPRALAAAEQQLLALAKKLAELSEPRASPSARELDDARVRAARLQAELAELRADRDAERRRADAAVLEAEAARTALKAFEAAHRASDERFAVLEKALKERDERLAVVEKAAKEREERMLAEVRERDEKLALEVRGREEQLAATAREREEQLRARAARLEDDLRQAGAQIAALTREAESGQHLTAALSAAREREAALDAELRLARAQRAHQDDTATQALRAEQKQLRDTADELQERTQRAELKARELQAVVDSLGRERAALRSEAGAMRARVEVLGAADERARRLQQEVDELRGENEFLNQELARVSAGNGRAGTPPPLTRRTP